MVGWAFIDKDCGNVMQIMYWTTSNKFPVGCPVPDNQVIVQIDDYEGDGLSYEAYDLANKVFVKRLKVTTDKVRTLLGSSVNITITYPEKVEGTAHLTIDGVTQDVYIVNGEVTTSYSVQKVGFINIIATSSTIYGLNYASVEVLS